MNSLLLGKHVGFQKVWGKIFMSTLKEGKNLPCNHLKSFGQPTYETHPHLLRQNEITPYIQKCEYQQRREKLMDAVVSYMCKRSRDIPNHIVVISSATKQYMSNKIPYIFRQNTEFLYLTGCQEPDSCLVLTATNSGKRYLSTLFLQEKDEHTELWDGPRTGPENAPTLFGVDQALPLSELENYMRSYIKTHRQSSLWYDFLSPLQTTVHKTLCDYLGDLREKMWESPKGLLHKQQLIKSPAEIRLMQKSCDVASAAIERTIEYSKPGMSEHEIFAKVDYECRINGAEFLAYPPVVAGGRRANTIHYINNNQIVDDGDMVLMDAGCEFHGYSSDITRTWPVSGKFSPEQKILYEAVLECQLKLIDLCRDMPTLDSLFESMCFYLGKNLQEIGVIKEGTPKTVMKAAYQFCPHHVSHYLGMDVHDTPTITRNIKMEPGMIITVEPGVYISEKHTSAPSQFRGLGIRIEDDVLITKDGPLVLTANCAKSVKEIEELASKQL